MARNLNSGLSYLITTVTFIIGGTGETNGSGAVKQPNAVFRSNSFRFERPPPEDDARMYLHGGRHGPVKSYSITAQDVRILF